MYPAFSVVFFTTASGAGYGLLALLGVFGTLGLLPAERGFGIVAFGCAFVLITAGLLSSTFHLGHPERAWRALTQWRSSWLSREGIMAIATYIPTGLYATGWIVPGRADGAFGVAGAVGALMCAITVFCTAMIYASLKSIPRWSNVWVAPAYLLLGLATGAILLALLSHLFGLPAGHVDAVAAATVVLAGAVKFAYWRSIAQAPARSSAASATGLGAPGQVRLLDAPHTETNYLLHEMGYRVARKHATRLRIVVAACLFVLPLGLLLMAMVSDAGPMATLFSAGVVAVAAVGVLVERWLFFAEAQHVLTLYYGADFA